MTGTGHATANGRWRLGEVVRGSPLHSNQLCLEHLNACAPHEVNLYSI